MQIRRTPQVPAASVRGTPKPSRDRRRRMAPCADWSTETTAALTHAEAKYRRANVYMRGGRVGSVEMTCGGQKRRPISMGEGIPVSESQARTCRRRPGSGVGQAQSGIHLCDAVSNPDTCWTRRGARTHTHARTHARAHLDTRQSRWSASAGRP